MVFDVRFGFASNARLWYLSGRYGTALFGFIVQFMTSRTLETLVYAPMEGLAPKKVRTFLA